MKPAKIRPTNSHYKKKPKPAMIKITLSHHEGQWRNNCPKPRVKQRNRENNPVLFHVDSF
jgi:hypothetical protein